MARPLCIAKILARNAAGPIMTLRLLPILFLGLIMLRAKGAVADSTNPATVTSAPSRASTTPPAPSAMTTWCDGPYLTGPWDGLRPQLADEGVTPYVYYNAIVAGNPVGGRQQAGPQYIQDLNFGLTFDMQKLSGWEGATFNVNGIERAGNTIKGDVGSVYDPMNLAGSQTYHLYNVTLEQKFWNDLGLIKFGRLSAGDDFATSPLYGYYVNNGIDGQIRAVVFDTQFFTYPHAMWGARLQFDPTPEWNVMTGVYQVSSRFADPDNHGVSFGINGSDGIFLIQQVDWTPEFDKQPTAPVAGESHSKSPDVKDMASPPKLVGMPGHYFIGGYWSNSDYAQFGTTVQTRISYGFYGHADQMVYRAAQGSDLGLTVFATVTYAPQQNVSLVPFQLSGGAIYQGLLPGRPKDQTIFGVIHGNFSSNYSNSLNAIGGPSATEETDYEWGYRVQVSQFAYIQPDVQYITNPSGTNNIPNAVVLGMQFGLTF